MPEDNYISSSSSESYSDLMSSTVTDLEDIYVTSEEWGMIFPRAHVVSSSSTGFLCFDSLKLTIDFNCDDADYDARCLANKLNGCYELARIPTDAGVARYELDIGGGVTLAVVGAKGELWSMDIVYTTGSMLTECGFVGNDTATKEYNAWYDGPEVVQEPFFGIGYFTVDCTDCDNFDNCSTSSSTSVSSTSSTSVSSSSSTSSTSETTTSTSETTTSTSETTTSTSVSSSSSTLSSDSSLSTLSSDSSLSTLSSDSSLSTLSSDSSISTLSSDSSLTSMSSLSISDLSTLSSDSSLTSMSSLSISDLSTLSSLSSLTSMSSLSISDLSSLSSLSSLSMSSISESSSCDPRTVIISCKVPDYPIGCSLQKVYGDSPFLYRPPLLTEELVEDGEKFWTNANSTIDTGFTCETKCADSFTRVVGEEGTNSSIDQPSLPNRISAEVLQDGTYIVFYKENGPICERDGEGDFDINEIKGIYSTNTGMDWALSGVSIVKGAVFADIIVSSLYQDIVYYISTCGNLTVKVISANYLQEDAQIAFLKKEGKDVEDREEELQAIYDSARTVVAYPDASEVVTGHITGSGRYKLFFYDSGGRLGSVESADLFNWEISKNF